MDTRHTLQLRKLRPHEGPRGWGTGTAHLRCSASSLAIRPLSVRPEATLDLAALCSIAGDEPGLLGPGPHSSSWVVGKLAKLHLHLQLLPIVPITAWAPPPVRSVGAVDSHRRIYVLESSWNHPPTLGLWKKLSSTKPVPGAKKMGDRCSKGSGCWNVLHLAIHSGLNRPLSWYGFMLLHLQQ